jgi:DNA primase
MTRYGVELRRAGRELVGQCPVHDDHRPSLRVSPGKNLWYCFPCGFGGDAIAFVMRLDGLGFAEAVREVVS